jgi:hypothetical protein
LKTRTKGAAAMEKKKRNALKAAGFRIGDAGDFLGLTQRERRLVKLRLTVSRAKGRTRDQCKSSTDH